MTLRIGFMRMISRSFRYLPVALLQAFRMDLSSNLRHEDSDGQKTNKREQKREFALWKSYTGYFGFFANCVSKRCNS